MFKGTRSSYLLLILALILAACQAPPASPEPVVETLVVTEVVEATPIEVIQVVTPTPEPSGPRTLTICLAGEPTTLYKFAAGVPPDHNILEAIEDGAIDNNSFAYQPVILEKLPSLADGDAVIAAVSVAEGGIVVDANGEIVTLDGVAQPPIMLVPAGGGDPVPYLGGTFQMDQLSVTFTLLPGLQWSDGTPLTAADSVYAFNLQADEDTPGLKDTIRRTASYQAMDDLTTLWTGLPGFMDGEYAINFFDPAPEHIWGSYSAAELLEAEESHRNPIGWGPYIIAERIEGESITLRKNPNYFRVSEGLPKFDTLIFRFVGDNTNANIASLLSGECDIVDRTALLSDQSQLLLELQDSDQLKATFTTGTIWEHMDFGIQHVDYDDGYQLGVDRPDFFSDVRTRQAFAMCMDRQALVDDLTLGQSLVMDTYLPPQHPQHNPEVRHYEFDVQGGSALLEEVGWVDEDGVPTTPRIAQDVANVPDGTRLAVALETSTSRAQIVEILQASLAQCGIQANVQTHNRTQWFDDGPEGVLFGRQYDLGGFSWLTGVELPCDLYLSTLTPGPAGGTWVSIQDGVERNFGVSGWFGQNNPGFAYEEYDAACKFAQGSLPGQPDFETAHLEAQRIFAEQLPVVPLYLQIRLAATRPDLCGFIMDPTNPSEFWTIEEFDYREGCQ